MAAATPPPADRGRVPLDLVDTCPLGVVPGFDLSLIRTSSATSITGRLPTKARAFPARRARRPIRQPAHYAPATKHVFASWLGITPEALSRVIRDLAEAGLIENRGRSVSILDGHRLAALVC
jgi:CRP-like cAMP-binding protein